MQTIIFLSGMGCGALASVLAMAAIIGHAKSEGSERMDKSLKLSEQSLAALRERNEISEEQTKILKSLAYSMGPRIITTDK